MIKLLGCLLLSLNHIKIGPDTTAIGYKWIFFFFDSIQLKVSFGQTPVYNWKFRFYADNGEDVDGLPTEGIEIACFHLVRH